LRNARTDRPGDEPRSGYFRFMNIFPAVSEVALRRRGRPVVAACVAGLVLSAPAVQAAPPASGGFGPAVADGKASPAVPDGRASRVVPPGAGRVPGGLPGRRPGCPPRHGIAASASEPWAQQALRFSAVWDRTRGGGVTVAIVDSGVDANPQFEG